MSDHNKAHATLSPSSAERWISCPASIRLVASLDRSADSDSVWAGEGTRAHTRAEIEASRYFGLSTAKEYRTRLVAWLRVAEEHGDDTEEMERHAQEYTALLADLKSDMVPGTTLHLEQRLQSGVPGCWGTGDATLVSPEVIRVVDYKYGKGVPVYAENNPQLRLYGLGALEMFDGILGDAKVVGMTIHQPRIGNISHEVMPAKALRRWRKDVVIPAAKETAHPDARFNPSLEACRWCPAAGICRPRAQHILARDFGSPDALDDKALAESWRAIEEVRNWCNAVEKEVLSKMYSHNHPLPGLKVVMSGGKRSIPNEEAAIERLVAAGYAESAVSRTQTQTLGTLEKLVGKQRLPEILGNLLVQGEGRPAVVDESDPRPAIDKSAEAQQDFSSNPDE